MIHKEIKTFWLKRCLIDELNYTNLLTKDVVTEFVAKQNIHFRVFLDKKTRFFLYKKLLFIYNNIFFYIETEVVIFLFFEKKTFNFKILKFYYLKKQLRGH